MPPKEAQLGSVNSIGDLDRSLFGGQLRFVVGLREVRAPATDCLDRRGDFADHPAPVRQPSTGGRRRGEALSTMKIHAYPRLHANMKFLYGPHTFTLPRFEGPRADVETRDDVARDPDSRGHRGGHRLPDLRVEAMSWIDAFLLAVIALASMAFLWGELS